MSNKELGNWQVTHKPVLDMEVIEAREENKRLKVANRDFDQVDQAWCMAVEENRQLKALIAKQQAVIDEVEQLQVENKRLDIQKAWYEFQHKRLKAELGKSREDLIEERDEAYIDLADLGTAFDKEEAECEVLRKALAERTTEVKIRDAALAANCTHFCTSGDSL